MSKLEFFDAHCYVGRYKTFRPGSFYKRDELLRQMRHFGISEALVTHSMAREHHPLDGNAAVVGQTKGKDNLHPCWAVLPTASKELPEPAELVRQMLANGVRAARAFFKMYKFSVSEWCIGDVLSELESHRVPIFLDPTVELDTWWEDQMDLDALDRLCESHKDLPVILSEARIRSSNRALYQLLAKHPNLRVELSGYWGYHAIEFVTREFGAHRLLFGTRMPVRDPACAIGQVTYSDISDEDKRLVAGDNLRGLLAGVLE